MHTSTTSKPLWLAAHVRACACGDQVILLDLVRGRYLGVPQSFALTQQIGGWPSEPLAAATSGRPEAVRRIADSLLAQRLLTENLVGSLPPTVLVEPTNSLDHDTPDPGVGPRTLARFLTAAAVTHLGLRFLSLDAIARGIASKRRAGQAVASRAELTDLTEPTAAYTSLRPLVFSARNHCLFDSLALLRFLSHWHLTPTWVIGVKTHPFAAHSWLQSGATVLNDHPDHVVQFRPILAV